MVSAQVTNAWVPCLILLMQKWHLGDVSGEIFKHEDMVVLLSPKATEVFAKVALHTPSFRRVVWYMLPGPVVRKGPSQSHCPSQQPVCLPQPQPSPVHLPVFTVCGPLCVLMG